MILPGSDHHLTTISGQMHRKKTWKFTMLRITLLVVLSIAFACIVKYYLETLWKETCPSHMDKKTIYIHFFLFVFSGIALPTLILHTVYKMFQICKSGKDNSDDLYCERKGKDMAQQERQKDLAIFMGSTCCDCQHCNDAVYNVFNCERKKEALDKQKGPKDVEIFIGSNYCDCQHCIEVFNKLRNRPSETSPIDDSKCQKQIDDLKQGDDLIKLPPTLSNI